MVDSGQQNALSHAANSLCKALFVLYLVSVQGLPSEPGMDRMIQPEANARACGFPRIVREREGEIRIRFAGREGELSGRERRERAACQRAALAHESVSDLHRLCRRVTERDQRIVVAETAAAAVRYKMKLHGRRLGSDRIGGAGRKARKPSRLERADPYGGVVREKDRLRVEGRMGAWLGAIRRIPHPRAARRIVDAYAHGPTHDSGVSRVDARPCDARSRRSERNIAGPVWNRQTRNRVAVAVIIVPPDGKVHYPGVPGPVQIDEAALTASGIETVSIARLGRVLRTGRRRDGQTDPALQIGVVIRRRFSDAAIFDPRTEERVRTEIGRAHV